MKHPTRALVGVILTLALAATGAAADPGASDAAERHDSRNSGGRDGFRIGVGLGAGSADVSFLDDREIGPFARLRLGWTVRAGLVVGFQGNVWWKDVDGATVVSRVTGFALTWYPAREGLYVEGSVGAGYLEISGGGASGQDTGFGAEGGAGYEFPLGASAGIGPRLGVSYLDVEGADVLSFDLCLAATLSI